MRPEPHVVVLITSGAAHDLSAQLADAARDALPGAGPCRWLAEGVAAEITVTCAPSERKMIAARVASRLSASAIDVAVVPAAGRRKRLLVADMDSTIIGQECIDELAELAGVRAEVSAITERGMLGEIDFVQSITERVSLLEGLPESALGEVARSRITLNPGAQALTATMRRYGASSAIISGGFSVFTEHVRRLAGFEHAFGNELEVSGGRLTGRLVPPVLDHGAKHRTLSRLTAELGLALEDTLAVGDGANDVDMIRAAGLGVAYRGKPILRAVADAEVMHGDLTALLYLQGYTAAEISA